MTDHRRFGGRWTKGKRAAAQYIRARPPLITACSGIGERCGRELLSGHFGFDRQIAQAFDEVLTLVQ
jgi:hypothetical protein